MNLRRRQLALSLLGMAFSFGLHAQDSQGLRLRSLAATCAQCHGTDGRAIAAATVPGLAGMPSPYLTDQMRAFKSGSRLGSVMPQLARGFSDAQIESLAGFFAAQRP